MRQKIEAIDFLRGFSIIAIIVIHVISLNDSSIWNNYTKVPSLFLWRDLLQGFVITIVVCSGFSLSTSTFVLNKYTLMSFYKKRIKRLLVPWWIFLAVFFGLHFLIKIIFKTQLWDLSGHYILSSFLTLGGIGIGWLVMLMVVITLLFPFLNYYYLMNRKILISSVLVVYIFSIGIFTLNPIDVFSMNLGTMFKQSFISLASLVLSYISGWSLIYLVGFVLQDLYEDFLSLRKELKITFMFIALFFLCRLFHMRLGLEMHFYLNKYPPTPYYLFFGLALTFVFLTFFYTYSTIIHRRVQFILNYFSDNSFWLFLWNAMTISLITPFLAMFWMDVGIRLTIDLLLNFIAVFIIVMMQKKIDIAIHREEHHF